RHVRNWAIAHISDVGGLDKFFFCNRAPAAERRSRLAREARAERRSAARGERLHAPRVADEGSHHGDAAQEENALRDMHAVRTQIQVAGDCPAAREGGAELLGADQDRRAQHGEHTLPDDPAIAAGAYRAVHVFILWAAIWAKGLAESRLA